MNRTLLPVLVLVAAVAACAGTKRQQRSWEEDLYYTHRLHIDGQHGLAAQRFSTLKDRATNRRDRDESALMTCTSLRKGKAFPEAAACFDELAKTANSRAIRTRALLHAGQVRYDALGKRQDALILFEALIKKAPGSPAGLRALDWLTLDGRRSPEATTEAVARMVRLERFNPRSQLADNLLLRAAMLLNERGQRGDRRRAIGMLERMESHHKHSSALLPGLVLRARLHRGFDEPRPEARALHAVVKTYETSYVFGTYIEPVHIRAMERLVELLAGPLRDPDGAEAMLQRLQSVVHKPARRFSYLAQLARIREARGDKRGALTAWRDLLSAVDDAQKDMRRNDERICKESNDRDAAARCLAQVRKFGPLPVKEAAWARAAITRLSGAQR